LVVLGSDAMLESPPAEEDEKESPKSFEFVPSNAKCKLLVIYEQWQWGRTLIPGF
jgi:hypothetical protein